MSINKANKNQENDLKILQEELERRYGPAVAQGIVDQIKKITDSGKTPDFMAVKACSEMLELFRGEAQALLGRLKARPRTWENAASNVTFLDKRKLEADFRHIYRLYWVSMKLFYPLYDRAMAGYQGKIAGFGKPSETTNLAVAA